MDALSLIPLLVVLSDSGQTDRGLPVVTPHPRAQEIQQLLERGFSGRWLRLYRAVEIYRRRGSGHPPEPAYLVLSDNEGGFPRFGFSLNGELKPDTAYVDLRRTSTLSGAFGAVDQIFPHELAHIMLRRLAGERPPGGASQIHAIGVRTDPPTAFDEGFAEHVQVRAIDDADAVPETRALAADAARIEQAADRVASYRRALEARWSLAPPGRLTFPLWFSGTEQILRYHAVKADAFSRLAAVPARLQDRPDPWAAYLIENVLPGEPGGPGRSPASRIASEGAVSAFMLRWVTDPEMARARADAAMYAAFGVDAAVSGSDNAYLKIFHATARARAHDVSALVQGYLETFPAERPALLGVLEQAGWPELVDPRAAELWLKSPTFTIGTSLFDQFRALPRAYTFDLNAATVTDLWTVPGMTAGVARALHAHAPYASLTAVRDVAGVPGAIVTTLESMAAAAERQRAEDLEHRTVLDLRAILMAYPKRAALWMAACALVAVLFGRAATSDSWMRLTARAVTAVTLGMLPAWVFDRPPMALLVPLLVCTPLAIWAGRRHGASRAWRVALGWWCAAVPGLLAVQPLF